MSGDVTTTLRRVIKRIVVAREKLSVTILAYVQIHHLFVLVITCVTTHIVHGHADIIVRNLSEDSIPPSEERIVEVQVESRNVVAHTGIDVYPFKDTMNTAEDHKPMNVDAVGKLRIELRLNDLKNARVWMEEREQAAQFIKIHCFIGFVCFNRVLRADAVSRLLSYGREPIVMDVRVLVQLRE